MSDPRDVRYRPALAIGLVVGLLALGAFYRLGSAGSSSATGAPVGMDAYRDPATGEFTTPPADVAADLDARAAQSPRRLVERPGVTAGGGVLLDGLPMGGMTATIDAAGHASARCGNEP